MKSDSLEKIKEDPKIRCLPDRFLAYVKWGVDNIERVEKIGSTWICTRHKSEEHAKNVVLEWGLDKKLSVIRPDKSFTKWYNNFRARIKEDPTGFYNTECSCGSAVIHHWAEDVITKPFKDDFDNFTDHKQHFDKIVNDVRLSYAAHGRLGGTANPKIIAAGLMYLFVVNWEMDLSQDNVARAFGVSTPSIRIGYMGARQIFCEHWENVSEEPSKQYFGRMRHNMKLPFGK
tara:strand:+ start:647 stop:1339 length:693 start_codon:yes stop_codon:yes gene_type:complete